MLLQKERELVATYGRKLSETRLSNGTSGNISIYNKEEGLMAISPSGIGYFDIKPEDVVVMDLKSNIVDGDKKPSSEWALHTAMYEARPEAGAVVHGHSMFCTIFACLREPLKAVHYAIADAGVATIPVAPYATFGSPELAANAKATIGESDGVLLANHGMIACGANIEKAFALAEAMEWCAELQYRTKSVGEPIVLDDAEMDVVLGKFKTYGQ